MTNHPPQSDGPGPADADLLERYLDGQLTGEQAALAAQRAGTDPAWGEAIAAQRKIDASLKRRFSAPPVDRAFLARITSGADGKHAAGKADAPATVSLPAPRDAGARNWTMHFVAASLLLVCCGLWGTTGYKHVRALFDTSDPYSERTVVQIYRGGVASGFKPDWLCKDDKEFAETFAERQGQALLLDPLPEGIRVAGLAYWEGLSEKATCLLTRVDGQPVLVLVERAGRVPGHLLDPDTAGGVNVYRQELAGLALIEVSPLDSPRVSEFFRTATVPPAPTGRVPGGPLP